MSLLDMFKRNRDLGEELSNILDTELFNIDVQDRVYLKESAIETCVNFMGRTISTADFRFVKNNKRIKHDFDYLLNVRPNKNQSSAEFWKEFIHTLLVDNEVLVILSDTNDLLIADSFDRISFALYDDIFTQVRVGNYTFERKFHMNEVIYMTYNNKKFTRFLDGMFQDYSELFSRMIETKMYENQIRALVGIDASQQLDLETTKRLNNFINRTYQAFKKRAFAIVPRTKGFEYEEVTAKQNRQQQPVEELESLRRDVTKQVANILGIPSALVFGELSEYETAMKAYVRLTAKPLVEQIKDELTAKLIARNEYERGVRLHVYGISEYNPIEEAKSADKMVASGVWSRNEVREKFGDERVDDERMDEYVITKNYQTLDDLEGGDKDV